MTLVSERVTADVIEAIEFPHLVQKYRVMGVPKTVVNEQHEVVGAVPEARLLATLKQAAGPAR